VLGPNLTRFGARPTIGAGALENTQENLERWIRDPRAVKAGALMPGTQRPAPAPGNPAGPAFPATGLTDEQVRAVAAYLLSLK
jgi:cytochrome c oxidase subunit 2